MFEATFKKSPQAPAFECMGVSITYAQLDIASRKFAAYLQSLGLKPGARVALMMPNVLQYPIALMGVLRAGCVVVNVNPLYTHRELEHQLKDSQAELIVILENFAHVLEVAYQQYPIRNVIIANLGEMLGLKGVLINFIVRNFKKMVPKWNLPRWTTFKTALEIGDRSVWVAPNVGKDDIAFIQYTGGTTGVSKGATLLHRNILANILQVDAWLEPGISGKNIGQMVTVCALPLYHVFALTVCGLLSMYKGGISILITNPRDLNDFVKTLSKLKHIHIFPAVNTLFNSLMNHAGFKRLNFSSWLIAIGGGMAVQKSVADEWIALTGIPIIEGYGLSETSPVVCCNTPLIKGFTGNVGLPLPSTEVSIRGDDGLELDIGVAGEICIRGPQLMAGYWNRPDETALAMTVDGFFKTGDIGIMNDQGYVKLVDRKKDMILVSGFNVYPNEVEEVIAMMSGVLECAVIGIPDENSGETVKAFVVRKDPSLTEQQIRDHCKAELTNYKRPKQIVFCGELPKNNIGKVLRRQLK